MREHAQCVAYCYVLQCIYLWHTCTCGKYMCNHCKTIEGFQVPYNTISTSDPIRYSVVAYHLYSWNTKQALFLTASDTASDMLGLLCKFWTYVVSVQLEH